MENTDKIFDYINFHIKLAKEKFTGKWTVAHAERMARIDGMIDILSMITEKSYTIGGINADKLIELRVKARKENEV